MGYFVVRSADETCCFDVPESDTSDGVGIIVYPHLHFGLNQQWEWINDQIVSRLDCSKCLGVTNFAESSPIVICSRRDTNTKWAYENGVFFSKVKPEFGFTSRHNKLLLTSTKKCPRWLICDVDPNLGPATSCHLTYLSDEVTDDLLQRDWEIENSVQVLESTDCTYFCVVGWAPGGYSGIQQIEGCKKVAIFSMWNEGCHNVSLISSGPEVVVSKFGGEGTGLKSMRDFDWKIGQKISFRVQGKRIDGNRWQCSCYFVADANEYFMATFERSGPAPLRHTGFYSFIEDWGGAWNGCSGTTGHNICRSAKFFDPLIRPSNRPSIKFTRTKFTKVEKETIAGKKAMGYVDDREIKCFMLSTGGREVSQICPDGCHLSL